MFQALFKPVNKWRVSRRYAKCCCHFFLCNVLSGAGKFVPTRMLEYLKQSQGLKTGLLYEVISGAVTCSPLMLEIELMSEFKSSRA